MTNDAMGQEELLAAWRTLWQLAEAHYQLVLDEITHRRQPILKVHRNGPALPMPKLPGDVGYNLPVVGNYFLRPGEFEDLPSGVRVEIPPGHFGIIFPRSRVTCRGILQVATGIIDQGFRGELKAFVRNMSDEPVEIRHGESVAQLVLFPATVFPVMEVDVLSDSVRGENGFGSTGA